MMKNLLFLFLFISTAAYSYFTDGVYDINDPTTTFNDGDIIHYDPLNGWQKIN